MYFNNLCSEENMGTSRKNKCSCVCKGISIFRTKVKNSNKGFRVQILRAQTCSYAHIISIENLGHRNHGG